MQNSHFSLQQGTVREYAVTSLRPALIFFTSLWPGDLCGVPQALSIFNTIYFGTWYQITAGRNPFFSVIETVPKCALNSTFSPGRFSFAIFLFLSHTQVMMEMFERTSRSERQPEVETASRLFIKTEAYKANVRQSHKQTSLACANSRTRFLLK